MGKVIRHSAGGPSDAYERGDPLQSVVAGSVEEIAGSDVAGSFPGEVEREPGCAAGKRAGDRIQFLAAVRQVVARDVEVRGAHCSDGGEQDAVIAVPKAMLPLRGLGSLNEG